MIIVYDITELPLVLFIRCGSKALQKFLATIDAGRKIGGETLLNAHNIMPQHLIIIAQKCTRTFMIVYNRLSCSSKVFNIYHRPSRNVHTMRCTSAHRILNAPSVMRSSEAKAGQFTLV